MMIFMRISTCSVPPSTSFCYIRVLYYIAFYYITLYSDTCIRRFSVRASPQGAEKRPNVGQLEVRRATTFGDGGAELGECSRG